MKGILVVLIATAMALAGFVHMALTPSQRPVLMVILCLVGLVVLIGTLVGIRVGLGHDSDPPRLPSNPDCYDEHGNCIR